MEAELLRYATLVIGGLISVLLAVIAYNANRIYTRLDAIERDLRQEFSQVWKQMSEHGQRITRLEATCQVRPNCPGSGAGTPL